jgi:D-alanyl-D-alanine dipeptidase
LGPGSVHQSQLGERRELPRARCQDNPASLLAHACAAGLARRYDRIAARAQVLYQQPDLRALSRAVYSFQRDEDAATFQGLVGLPIQDEIR